MLNESRLLDGGLDAHISAATPALAKSPTSNQVGSAASLAPSALATRACVALPLTLFEILALGAGRSSWSSARCLRACHQFAVITGVHDLASIPPGTLAAYADAELSRGLAEATVAASIAALSMVIRTALKRANQGSRVAAFDAEVASARAVIKVAMEERELRRVEDVWRLFNSGSFIDLKTSPTFEHRAAYWAALLSLFTGIRLSSLSRVSPSDFEWTSCWGYFIRYERRGVVERNPIHDELFRCGLADFIEERRLMNAALLLSDGRSDALLRDARRVISCAWLEAPGPGAAPSWDAFQTARRFESNEVFEREPKLKHRLDDLPFAESVALDAMDLYVDLERAVRFDHVQWGRHRCAK